MTSNKSYLESKATYLECRAQFKLQMQTDSTNIQCLYAIVVSNAFDMVTMIKWLLSNIHSTSN